MVVFDGDASEFISRLNSNESAASVEGKTWNDAQNEVFLHDYMRSLYEV